MLLSNIFIDGKLSNGSIGIVKKIVYDKGIISPSMPKFVVVEF